MCSSAHAMVQHFTSLAQKMDLENKVRDKEAVVQELENELEHLNTKKTSCETEWASVGKKREGALLEVCRKSRATSRKHFHTRHDF